MDEVIRAKRQQTTGAGTRAITIRGAREHNLKNVDLEIPRDRWWCSPACPAPANHRSPSTPSMPRASAATSKSLSAYARQFLEMMQKPDVDQIDGLSPAISIEQKTTSQESALHRRHRHRDLRLHAPVVGAGRRALFARDRPADREPDRLADGRSRAGAAGRHAALSAGAGGARPQGRIPQGARRISQKGISAGQDRRHVLRAGGSADARQEIPARHRRRGGPHRGAAGHRPAAGGKFRDRAEARRGPGGDRICRRARTRRPGDPSKRRIRQEKPQRSTTRAGRSGSCSRRNSPARSPASPFRKSSPGCSPSTIPMAPARPAAGSGSSSISTRISSFPTRK